MSTENSQTYLLAVSVTWLMSLAKSSFRFHLLPVSYSIYRRDAPFFVHLQEDNSVSFVIMWWRWHLLFHCADDLFVEWFFYGDLSRLIKILPGFTLDRKQHDTSSSSLSPRRCQQEFLFFFSYPSWLFLCVCVCLLSVSRYLGYSTLQEQNIRFALYWWLFGSPLRASTFGWLSYDILFALVGYRKLFVVCRRR